MLKVLAFSLIFALSASVVPPNNLEPTSEPVDELFSSEGTTKANPDEELETLDLISNETDTTFEVKLESNLYRNANNEPVSIIDGVSGEIISTCTEFKLCTISLPKTNNYELYATNGVINSDVLSLSADNKPNKTSNQRVAAINNWSVTLISDKDTFTTDQNPVLTATNTSDTSISGGSNYGIYVFDTTKGTLVREWANDNSIATSVKWDGLEKTRNYKAYIARWNGWGNTTSLNQLTDIKAQSEEISLTRANWTLNLSALSYLSDGRVELKIEPNQSTTQTYHLVLYNQTRNKWSSDLDVGYRFVEGGSIIFGYIGIPILNSSGDTIGVKDVQTTSNVVSTLRNYGNLYDSSNRPIAELYSGSNPSKECYQTCEADPVSTLTGEYWDTVEDIAPLTGFTPPLSFARNYSSSRSNETRSLGNGWFTNYDMKIVANNAYPSANTGILSTTPTVDIIQENGSTVSFYKTLDGNYVSSLSTKANLKYSNNSFVFERQSGEVFLFNANGVLTNIKDKNGNTLDLAYNANNQLIEIKDVNSGKTIVLTWVANKISTVVSSTGLQVKYVYTGNNLSSITDVNGNVASYKYDTSNRLIKKVNSDLSEVNNEYNTKGQVTYQYDELNRQTRFSYGTPSGTNVVSTYTEVQTPDGVWKEYTYKNGQLTQVDFDSTTSSNKRTVKYEYDTNSRLSKKINADGTFSLNLYDNRGNIISHTNELNQITTTTYDNFDNPLVLTDPQGKTTKMAYDSIGRLISLTDGLGNVVTTEWNTQGLLAKTVSAKSAVTKYSYDSSGFIISTEGALGNIALFDNDANGNVIKVTDSLGHTTLTEYNAYGDVTKTTDNSSHQISYVYDKRRNLVSTTYPNGTSTSTTYNAFNLPVTKTDSAGNISIIAYDAMSRITKTTSPEGKVNSFTYNKHGELTETINPANNKTINTYNSKGLKVSVTLPSKKVTTFEYDKLNRVTKQVNPDSTFKTYVYDASGNVSHLTDEENRTYVYAYNQNDALVAVTRPDGKTESYDYDADGNNISYTDASGNEAIYTYDLLNRSVNTSELGNAYKYVYDANSNLKTKVDLADNSSTVYSYDAIDQLKSVSYSDEKTPLNYSYDVMGQVDNITDETGNTSFTYDNLGRTKTVKDGNNALIKYSYDKDSNLTSLTYPNNKLVNYTYNANSQISKITSTDLGNISYTYNVDGLLATSTYPNGFVETNTYDASNSLSSQDTKFNSLPKLNYTYNYDKSGVMINKNTNTSGIVDNKSYAYDSLKRLTSVNDGSQTIPIEYNDIHSLVKDSSGKNYTYNNSQQVTSTSNDLSTNTYSYDIRGNRIGKTTVAPDTTVTDNYNYNVANQLVEANLGANPPTGKNVTYSYNALGLRTSKVLTENTQSVQSSYTWDVTRSVPTLLEDKKFQYIYGAGSSPVAQINKTTNKVEYFHKDNLGSIRAVSDKASNVTAEYLYDEYGNVLKGDKSHTVTSFSYAGEYLDTDTNLYYLRARWYDPNSGQFTSVDPIVNQTHLSYSYTAGNPLQYVDPLGLSIWSDFYSSNHGWVDDLANYSAGFGDTASFGISVWTRENWSPGVNDRIINECGTYYTWGTYSSYAVDAVFAIKGLLSQGFRQFAKETYHEGKQKFGTIAANRKNERGQLDFSKKSAPEIPTVRRTQADVDKAVRAYEANKNHKSVNQIRKLLDTSNKKTIGRFSRIDSKGMTSSGNGHVEMPHIQFKGGGSPAVNIDGTWKENSNSVKLTNAEKKFLKDIGWGIPE